MAGHRWAKIDLGYLRNPKIRGLQNAETVLLHLASILYAGDQLTDGQITYRDVTDLGQEAFIAARWRTRRAGHLVDSGLWIPTSSGYRVHDFEEMNPALMRENVETERKRARERQRAWRERHNAVTDEDVTP